MMVNPVEKKILITGGLGYVGSHVTCELLENNHDVILLDNIGFKNNETLKIIEKLHKKKLVVYKCDLRDEAAVTTISEIIEKEEIGSIIHLAALKSVNESVIKPLDYYNSNIQITINLLRAIGNRAINLIYSSSALIYDMKFPSPFKEDDPIKPINPYAWTKYISEQIIRDYSFANEKLRHVAFRYFNPVGAHKSKLLGENPKIPHNLFPYITQVAAGIRENLTIYGKDYPTPDGTGMRDYIHISDLAKCHRIAIEKMINAGNIPEVINIGTGKNYTVLQVIKEFEKIIGKKIKYKISERRKGDMAILLADNSLSKKYLGIKKFKNLEKMCYDAWEFQNNILKNNK